MRTDQTHINDAWPALEMTEHNITVNAYAPGLILTDMSTDAYLWVRASWCTDTKSVHAAASNHDAHFGGTHGAALKTVSGLIASVRKYRLTYDARRNHTFSS